MPVIVALKFPTPVNRTDWMVPLVVTGSEALMGPMAPPGTTRVVKWKPCVIAVAVAPPAPVTPGSVDILRPRVPEYWRARRPASAGNATPLAQHTTTSPVIQTPILASRTAFLLCMAISIFLGGLVPQGGE